MTIERGGASRGASWPVLGAAAAWTGLALYFSTAGNGVPALAWIAPVPVLALAFALAGARREGQLPDRRAAWRLGVATFLAGTGGQLAWAVLYRGIFPAVPLVGFAALLGAALALAVQLTRAVASRAGTLAGVLAYPAAWVSVELALARLSPHGTMGSVAYSQAGVPQLLQLAAWTGLSGITFVVGLAASSLAAALGDRGGWRSRRALVALPLAVAGTALLAGQLRTTHLEPAGRAVIGLASIDGHMRRFDTTRREDAIPVLADYLEAADALAARGAEAVVFPEKMLGVAPFYEDEVSRALVSLARPDQAIVVAGLNYVARGERRNVAAVFARGARRVEYDKQRLVPGFEDGYRRGRTAGVYDAPGGRIGVAICKDLDFPEITREYARAGVGILLVPAWDFGRDAALHARMATVRGVEGGFSVARAAADGLLTGSDMFGRVIAERPTSSSARALLLAKLPLGRGRTFYAEHGDWFGWLNVAATLALAAAAGLRRRRER